VPPVETRVALPAEPLRQALVAVVQNAFDASSPDQHVAIRMEHGPGLRVQVVDHGRGMDAEELACATDPFFTTKPAGAGLGLGLFLVRAFVDQMGGSLRVNSTPGVGTTVELTLPVTT
jgi:two-component system sensor histidine kinase RegB